MIAPGRAVANVEQQFKVEEDNTDLGQQYKKGTKNYKLLLNVLIKKIMPEKF
ncbi:MAG: hypothetical protein H7258_10420 [Ferruginibacter sp.]|nr:hypothetical protein [Ferruginibacter sp.]